MRLSLLFVVLVAATGIQLSAQRSGRQASARSASEVTSNLASRIEPFDGIGVIVGEVDHGNVRVSKVGHLSGNVKLDENTVFEIGSVTKVFTATLLAEMVQDGEVSLDDPIQEYLPAGVEAPLFDGVPIRLVNLAEQNSGLPREGDYSPSDADAQARYDVPRVYAFLSKAKLASRPGDVYSYSNFGVALLADILARRERMTFGALLRKRIFLPLRMKSTAVIPTDALRKRLASPESADGIPTQSMRFTEGFQGAGAVLSTMHDMLLFLKANLSGRPGRLERAMTFAQQPRVEMPYRLPQKIGLIWMTQSQQPITWHNGATFGYRSFIGFDRSIDRGVVVLSNQTSSIDDVGFHILDQQRPLLQAPPIVTLDQRFLDDLAGRYQLDDAEKTILTVVAGRQRLVVSGGSATFVLLPLSKTVFHSNDATGTFTFEGDALSISQPGQSVQIGSKL